MLYDRADVLAATDLRALADDLLGPGSAGRRNPTWHCPNAEHAQTGRTPPVTIFLSHRGEQRWRCHGCGSGGTAIDLVMAARRTDVRNALELLAARSRLQPTPEATWRRRDLERRARPDPDGFARYVADCADRLWRPEGRAVLDWLTGDRGLDPDTLRVNGVGADPGPRAQRRPRGMPCTAGVVLAAVDHDGAPAYAQLRLLHPRPDQPRYLNPSSGLIDNPRLTHLRPPEMRRSQIIVTEGAVDALTAASAGYRAVAILGAGYPDEAVAAHLARLHGPIVLAFDPDAAGTLGGRRLAQLLAARHRPAVLLPPGSGDLNDLRLTARDWPARLDDLVAAAAPASTTQARHQGLGVA